MKDRGLNTFFEIKDESPRLPRVEWDSRCLRDDLKRVATTLQASELRD